MALAHVETRSAESYPRLRASWFQELINIQFLEMLSRQLRLFRQGDIESFNSDVATSTGVIEITGDDDLRKVPLLFVEIGPELVTENETRILDDPEEELKQFRKSMYRTLIGPSISEEDEDLLDWDMHIETEPAPRRSGTISVRFKYVGRSRPIPIDDPWS